MSLNNVLFPERFKNPARYYTTGRPTYPKLLARRVADLVKLASRDAVLDLGTGPGFLAIDYAPLAYQVTAVDPSEEMLTVARENAARAQVNVAFLKGSSFDLPAGIGPFKLVTMGRSFHWMDREQTLAALDGLVVPGGAIATFSERYPELPDNAWYPEFRALLDSYATKDPAQPRTRSLSPHEAVLHAGGFDHLERISVLESRQTPVEHIVHRALSFGASWDGRPGSREDDLALEVRALVAKSAKDGLIREVIEGQALIGFRSRDLSH
ncbi:MAG: SAM-dependent methyltransferase [Myxococcaceae bacterium]|nr:SAM-dependent methyltransferase [Myxococcaceae bacterium]